MPPTGPHKSVLVAAAPCGDSGCTPVALLTQSVEMVLKEQAHQGSVLAAIAANVAEIKVDRARAAGVAEGQAKVVGLAKSVGPWVWRSLVVLLLGLVLALSILLGVGRPSAATVPATATVPVLAPVPATQPVSVSTPLPDVLPLAP